MASFQEPKVQDADANYLERQVAEFFGKFGVLRTDDATGKPLVKLYRSGFSSHRHCGGGRARLSAGGGGGALGRDDRGELNGDGRVGFLKEASIPLVLQLADGHFFREGQVDQTRPPPAKRGRRTAVRGRLRAVSLAAGLDASVSGCSRAGLSRCCGASAPRSRNP